MREKQRRAELIKQGIDPDADVEKKKDYNEDYMKQYQFDYGDEEELAPVEEEESKEETKEPVQPTKKGKKQK